MIYKNSDVCAVMISYNCDNLDDIINKIVNQVDKLIIIDNNSNANSLVYLKKLNQQNIDIVFNEENFGQATALNQGLEIVRDRSYKLMLTLDQDSYLSNDMVKHLLKAINDGWDSVGPNYNNEKIKNEVKEKRYLITSGNLVKVECMVKIGGYDDSFFIDSVDFDQSLNLRKHGFKIGKVDKAYMKHSIGELKKTSAMTILEHSPLRYYYISRNHYILIYKYFKFDPIFCLKKEISLRLLFLHILLEDDKLEKFKAIRKGKAEFKRMKKGSKYAQNK